MQLTKYYFENFPENTPFDVANPRYVLTQGGVDDILTKVISAPPYTMTVNDFEDKTLLDALLYTDILQIKGDKLGMAVPFFIERDAEVLRELSKSAAGTISDRLIANKERLIEIISKVKNGHSTERNLYHLLCGYIFDGRLFDYLEESDLVTTSLVHSSGLDYLVIVYEDTKVLNEYSDKLLCSYNRLIIDGSGFESFGDSDGERKDLYRFMRRRELHRLIAQEKKYSHYSASELIRQFGRMIGREEVPSEYMEVFTYFDYCHNGKISVPVYDQSAFETADELYEYVLSLVKDSIAHALNLMKKEKRLVVTSHEVETKDIANEIYHLIFGEVNELLVKNGLVARPEYYPGEGRYLKCFVR